MVGISCEDRKHRTLGDLLIHNLEFKNWARTRESEISRERERERERERQNEREGEKSSHARVSYYEKHPFHKRALSRSWSKGASARDASATTPITWQDPTRFSSNSPVFKLSPSPASGCAAANLQNNAQ